MTNEEALRELFPEKTLDQSAYSVKDLIIAGGLQHAQTSRKIEDAVREGTWEQVWKVGDSGRVVKAYRPRR